MLFAFPKNLPQNTSSSKGSSIRSFYFSLQLSLDSRLGEKNCALRKRNKISLCSIHIKHCNEVTLTLSHKNTPLFKHKMFSPLMECYHKNLVRGIYLYQKCKSYIPHGGKLFAINSHFPCFTNFVRTYCIILKLSNFILTRFLFLLCVSFLS